MPAARSHPATSIRSRGALSGILCTGILGGAIVPLLVGLLGDWLGLKAAMMTVFVTLVYILGISFWARPLVRNETLDWKALLRRRASSNP
jgi:FHS family L-fucose permease-like MFS transporter